MDPFPEIESPWRAVSEGEPIDKTHHGEIIGHKVVGNLIELRVRKPDGTHVSGEVHHTPSNVAQILTGTIELPVDDENH